MSGEPATPLVTDVTKPGMRCDEPPSPPQPYRRSAQPSETGRKGWQAALELGFERREGRSVLAKRSHRGPLLVQRPYYPSPSSPCQVTVLHPPSGIVGGDRLEIWAEVAEGAGALITTPAATRVYRSAGARAQLRQRFRIAPGASGEWLPQESLLFDRCRVHFTTQIELFGDARFSGWEIVGLGLPASGRPFRSGDGDADGAFEVWRDGRPLFLERTRYRGGSPLLAAQWGLAGRSVSATWVCTHADASALALVRERLTSYGPTADCAGATLLEDLLVVRLLADETRPVLDLLASLWSELRPLLLGHPAEPPRIWST